MTLFTTSLNPVVAWRYRLLLPKLDGYRLSSAPFIMMIANRMVSE